MRARGITSMLVGSVVLLGAAAPTRGDQARAGDAPPALPPSLVGPCAAPLDLYPPVLRREGVQGEVRMRVTVGENGRPAEVEVLAAPHPKLGELSRRWMKTQCRFDPARDAAGQPMRSVIEYRFAWQLETVTLVEPESPALPPRLLRIETSWGDVSLYSVEVAGSWTRQDAGAPGLAIRSPLWHTRRRLCAAPCLVRVPAESPDLSYFIDGRNIVRSGTFELPRGSAPATVEVHPGWWGGRVLSVLSIGLGAVALVVAGALYVNAHTLDVRRSSPNFTFPPDYDPGYPDSLRSLGMKFAIGGGVAVLAGIIGTLLTITSVTVTPD